MVIFYAQTDHPDLSVDVIPIGRVISDLGVFDSLDSRVDITFSLAQGSLWREGILQIKWKIYFR